MSISSDEEVVMVEKEMNESGESQVNDERERRNIRHRYREMINDTQKQREELAHPDSDVLSEKLNEVNVLFRKVKKTREAALDSHLIYLFAAVGKQQAQALHTDFHNFQPLEFAEKLISFMRTSRIDTDGEGSSQTCNLQPEHWIEFGKTFGTLLKKTPSFHYLYGSFETGDVQVKERRKPRKNKEKESPIKAVTPTRVGSLGDSNQETTTEEVEEILRLLRRLYIQNERQPICYFEFVTNPHSFAHTVENMFHVSFLIKDGAASIYLDDDNLPVIEPVIERNGEEITATTKQHQIVMSITIEEWKAIVETFKIKKPLITPRNQRPKLCTK